MIKYEDTNEITTEPIQEKKTIKSFVKKDIMSYLFDLARQSANFSEILDFLLERSL